MDYGKRAHYDEAALLISSGVWRIDLDNGLIYGTGRSHNNWKPIGTVRDGYVRVSLGYKKPCVSAHRVIWESVYGPSDLSLTINHKNCNKSDNRISNLELATNRENVTHAFSNGRGYGSRNLGSKNPMSKLSEENVREIKTLLKQGTRGKDISTLFGISQGVVSQIKHGYIWNHVEEGQ